MLDKGKGEILRVSSGKMERKKVGYFSGKMGWEVMWGGADGTHYVSLVNSF